MRSALLCLSLLCVGCAAQPARTLAMVRLPDTQCSIDGIKELAGDLAVQGSDPVETSFQSLPTYFYVRLKQKTELLLVTDKSQSDRPMLMVSLIAANEPTFFADSVNALASLARDCTAESNQPPAP